MALSRVKTWSNGETLTADDLNSEFNNILNNPVSLLSPLTAALDMNGLELILDSDADTSITADSDDRIDFLIGGTDGVRIGHDSTNSSSFTLVDPGAFTAQASTNVARLRVGNTNAVTVPAGTTAIASSLRIDEPNLTATGTVTTAVSLYVAAAPSEGSTNYAVWVDAGDVKLDGALTVDGAATFNGSVSGVLANVVEDTTPQLGGQLDVNGQALGDGTLELLTFTETGSAINHVNITNAAIGNGPTISAAGDDTNVPLNLVGKGTGQVQIGDAALKFPDSDGSANQAMVTDGSGSLSFADVDALTPDTAQTVSNGSETKDFTGLPAGLNLIIVVWSGYDSSSNITINIQIGDSGGLETTGYSSTGARVFSVDSAGFVTSTSAFAINLNADTGAGSGIAFLARLTGNQWVCMHVGANTAQSSGFFGAGTKTLTAELDRVRIALSSAGGTGEAGDVNILYM